MTSTTATGSPPEVLDEIEALFSWNPPRLILAPKKWHSTTTRLPSFYDKHFSTDLVLKRVERLPSLVQDLASNVDKALSAASATLPPLKGFITAEQRRFDLRRIEKEVTDEKGVTNFYDKYTAKYCSDLASTLALHPAASFSEWDSLLIWTQSVSSSGYAIRDGLLRFIAESDEEIEGPRAHIVESMENAKRHIFEEMRKSKTPLASYEITSLSAGSVEVMIAVPNLGKFYWTYCDARKCHIPEHEKARSNVKQVVVGPDAQAPPWTFPDNSLSTSLDPENHDREIGMLPFVSHLGAPPAPRPQPVTKSGPSTLPSQPPSSSSEHESTAKEKGKKRKRDDEDKDEGDEDEAFKDRHDMSAQSLVQQAWAQAVRVDTTVVVLHSGNYELVCLRHRGSQTLYVSDVIEPPTCSNPGYGKLQVGVYIAAIQDAMDRWQQLSSTIPHPKPSDGGDLTGGNKSQGDQDHDRGSGSGHKGGRGRRGGRGRGGRKTGKSGSSARKKDLVVDELAAIEKTIHEANNRDVVLLYLQYDVYDSLVPASFLRSAPSLMAPTKSTPPASPRAARTYRSEECLTVVLTSEIGRGATGVVHSGILKPENSDGTSPLDVVVKLAFDFDQRDALRSEYEVYRRLRSNRVSRGIGTVLGFFDDLEDAACALVMRYAGVPLDTEPRPNFSKSECTSALSTLKSIHGAGILHGDIRQENILVDDLGGVTIIDFGHSSRCDDQEAKDEEYARLCHFLRLARKSLTSVA